MNRQSNVLHVVDQQVSQAMLDGHGNPKSSGAGSAWQDDHAYILLNTIHWLNVHVAGC